MDALDYNPDEESTAEQSLHATSSEPTLKNQVKKNFRNRLPLSKEFEEADDSEEHDYEQELSYRIDVALHPTVVVE